MYHNSLVKQRCPSTEECIEVLTFAACAQDRVDVFLSLCVAPRCKLYIRSRALAPAASPANHQQHDDETSRTTQLKQFCEVRGFVADLHTTGSSGTVRGTYSFPRTGVRGTETAMERSLSAHSSGSPAFEGSNRGSQRQHNENPAIRRDNPGNVRRPAELASTAPRR